MAIFIQGYTITMGNEGGIANDPDDAGGLTYKGITERDWPNWAGWPIVKNAMAMSKNTTVINQLLAANVPLQVNVQAFYKRYYWDVNRLDLMTNQAIANELFDTAVNCGTGTAALFLQQSLNVLNNVHTLYANIVEDGAIGPQTLALTNAHPYPKDVLLMLNVLQGGRYFDIARKKENQEKFMRSWLSRVRLNTQ